MTVARRKNLTADDLEGRLNCFGEFEENDSICLKACVLSINCAIAKNRFLGYQLMDDPQGIFAKYDSFESE